MSNNRLTDMYGEFDNEDDLVVSLKTKGVKERPFVVLPRTRFGCRLLLGECIFLGSNAFRLFLGCHFERFGVLFLCWKGGWMLEASI
jgi:hypothetical protein